MSRIAYVPLEEGEVIHGDHVIFNILTSRAQPVKDYAPAFIGHPYSKDWHEVIFRPGTLPQWVRFEERLPEVGDFTSDGLIPVRDASGKTSVAHSEFIRIDRIVGGKTQPEEWLSGLNGVK